MPRKPPAPKPAPKPDNRIKQVPFRLLPDDLDALDRIVAHYHLTSRVDAVRLAVRHVADNMAPITATAPKSKGGK